MGVFAIFASYFGTGWWVFLAVIEILSFLFFSACLKGTESRAAVIDWLNSRRGTHLYERWVGAALDWIDCRLTPDDTETNPPTDQGLLRRLAWSAENPQVPDRASAIREGRRAFGWPVFDFALRLAIAYPLLLLIGHWALSGQDRLIGNIVVLRSAAEHPFVLVEVIGGMVLLFGFLLFMRFRRPAWLRSEIVIALLLTGTFVTALSLGFKFGIAVAFALLSVVALATIGVPAIAIAFAAGYSLIPLLEIGVAFALLLVFAAAMNGALTMIFAISIPFVLALSPVFPSELPISILAPLVSTFGVGSAYPFASAVIFALSLAVSCAVSYCGSSLLFSSIRRGLDGRFTYFIFVAILLLPLLQAAEGAYMSMHNNAFNRIWLILLGVLPLANACFDYLSFGTTRWLIRKGWECRDGRTLLLGAADMVSALILFTGLGLFLIAIVTAINSASISFVFSRYAEHADISRDPLPLVLDLQATLTGIKRNPQDYWWLYLSFFSTLVPTFFHFAISTACLVWMIPRKLRLGVVGMLENEARGDLRVFWAPMILSLMGTFAVAAPIALSLLVAACIQSAAPEIGNAYLWLFATFANWLGAPVHPGTMWG